MKKFSGGWSITFVCMIIGFMLAVQIRQVQDAKESLPNQKLSDRSFQVEETRAEIDHEFISELKFQAGMTALEGEGIIIKMDDSTRDAKSGENPNLYLIHDEDILRVINELRAAGAEAISINGQRLISTSEIRCAGPTISVNNVRSAAPFVIKAIGEKKSLENSIKMRGGVEETLKVWGIQLEVATADKICIPSYNGIFKRTYSKIVEENS